MSAVIKENGRLHNALSNKEGLPFYEIFSRNPGFLISWSLLIFFFIFCTIITFTWMIRYPEIVQIKTALTVKANEPAGYASIYIPQKELNKVKPGMQVQLHVDGYSYGEYGFIAATVQQIADSVTDQGLKAWLVLPAGLRTTRGKAIPLSNELKVDAVIIVKDLRLLQRLFNKTTKSLKV